MRGMDIKINHFIYVSPMTCGGACFCKESGLQSSAEEKRVPYHRCDDVKATNNPCG